VLSGIEGLRSGTRLDRAIASLVRRLGPGAPAVRTGTLGPQYARALAIGRGARGLAERAVHVDGDGWSAAVGLEPVSAPRPARGRFNPFGPLVAAAWGVSELAKLLFTALDTRAAPDARDRFPLLGSPRHWDLWSHSFCDHGFGARPGGPPLAVGLDLGDVGVAGLGALGSAAVFALAHVEGARGRLELVDDDLLSPTNLERVLLARASDVGRPKVNLARRALRNTALRTTRVSGRYGPGWPARTRAKQLLVGVDSGAARRQIAALEPHAVYNGGTQSSEFLVSRHLAAAGPCLGCLYPEVEDPIGRIARRLGVERDTAAALLTGDRRLDGDVVAQMRQRGGIELDGIEVGDLLDEPLDTLESFVCSRAVIIEDLPEATIGFVAALCGFLMACELVKDRIAGERGTPLDRERPAFRLDVLSDVPGEACVERYVARRSCACQLARDPAPGRERGDVAVHA
jgi:hypothetical protein